MDITTRMLPQGLSTTAAEISSKKICTILPSSIPKLGFHAKEESSQNGSTTNTSKESSDTRRILHELIQKASLASTCFYKWILQQGIPKHRRLQFSVSGHARVPCEFLFWHLQRCLSHPIVSALVHCTASERRAQDLLAS